MHKVSKLRKGWEFDLLFRTGIRANDDKDADTIKFGLAVGKRLGKAHIRVRGRRILREAFRHLSDRLTPGLSIVLGLKPQGIDAKTQDIMSDLERLFRRRKLFADIKS